MKIIELPVVTSLDVPAERILSAAIDANLSGVIIAGYEEDGEYYFASSIADGGECLWLIEQFKKELLDYE